MIWVLTAIIAITVAFVVYLIAGHFTGEEPSIKKFFGLLHKMLIPW